MRRGLGVMTLSGALCISSLVGVAGATGNAPPPSLALGKPTRATTKKPPPTRPCVGDCVVPSKYRSYEGFLLWSGDDLRRMWSQSFSKAGRRFSAARQLIISGTAGARTRCGGLVIRTTYSGGPFYCPADKAVFLPTDTTKKLVFGRAADYRLRDYRERDFAFSFIVAHEWAHHVQALLGVFQVRPAIPTIRTELQADCLAGVWAYSAWARSLLETGDIQEGLRLASLVGDLPGTPPGDPTAHGTSKQRMDWFMRGYSKGVTSRCDTSSVPVK